MSSSSFAISSNTQAISGGSWNIMSIIAMVSFD